MNPKKCLIIHSLKLITGGMILSLRAHNCPAKKHVIKGRSLDMSRVSRTHRVAFDWLLFDRINFRLGIGIKFVDTTKRISEILTTEIFHS